MTRSICRGVSILLLSLALFCPLARMSSAAMPSTWPASSVIYTIYPSIFSPQHSFAGITAQLGRLKSLGVNVVWLMPISPIGHAFNGHPSVNSPYCVHDFFAVNPDYGTPADLRKLVSTAHSMGIKVILDEVLNHSSWDNPLITQHPEYYVHTDGNPKNPASVKMAFTYSDVAQFNYANPGLRAYMIKMLRYWITQYKVDGYRFDSANDPDGSGRMIPADFWMQVGQQLKQAKPNVLLLEEGESPELALKPFNLDYGWNMYGAIKGAATGGDATQVHTSWKFQKDSFPPGMLHMAMQDDWDDPRDVNTFGGPTGAQAVAVFDFTDTGIPLIYNGMEVGNSAEAVNPHAPIKWSSGNPQFTKFYRSLIALRKKYPALQQGQMTWLTNTASKQVLTYVRSGAASEFLVEINLSGTAASGTVAAPSKGRWMEIAVPGALETKKHASPPQVSLGPKEFAIFQRSAM